MEILDFIKNYWTQLSFLFGIIVAFSKIYISYKKATLCSLRNDILEIWNRCKDKEAMNRCDMEAYTESRDLYFKLKGDGFVHAIDQKIMNFKIID